MLGSSSTFELLTRLGSSMSEVQAAIADQITPRVVPAAEKTVYVLNGKMDRAETHLLHLQEISVQTRRQYADAVHRATEQSEVAAELGKEHW